LIARIRAAKPYSSTHNGLFHRGEQDLLQGRADGRDGKEVAHRFPSLRCFKYSPRESMEGRVVSAVA
jgi:hypothetical protein